MEYRIEKIHFDREADRYACIARRLNEFAAEGWRVVSIDLAVHPSFAMEDLHVLLQRSKN